MKDGRKVGEIKDVKLVYPNALGVITNIEEPDEVNPPRNIEAMYGAGQVTEEPVNQKAESPRIPEFIELMHKSINVHIKKNKDYASAENPFSNFERSAEIASWFLYDSDKSFAVLVGTKLARIAELTDGRLPNNESLDDSFLDLVTYCALWGAFHKRFKTGSPLNTTA
jgi:hypothetical protein